jgi:hypothetical protein
MIMIEKAARAASAALGDPIGGQWDGLTEGEATAVVRAVLLAIRDPSEAMVNAGIAAYENDEAALSVAAMWPAMLDAIRAEKTP